MDKEEAMKILKDFHDKSALFSVRTALDTIIPELRESEDEKIRKAIIKLVRQSSEVLDKQNQNNMITWLEKQKEYESTDFEYVWNRTDCGALTSALDKYSEEAIINMCHAWYDKGIELERKSWLEKQGEERTINYPIEGMFPYTEPADTLDGEIENIWNKLRNCDNTFTAAKSGFYEVIHHFATWLEKQGCQNSVDKEYTFKSIPRLLDMIEPTDRAKSYCKKLIDSLQTEGYSVDAKIVGECLKQMNGEKVAMAVMDNEKQDEKKSQRMVSSEAKEALYDKPTDEEMKELLRTEYEKGRADTIAEMKSSWSEEDENGLGDALWAIKQARTIVKDENDMGNLWYAENWLNSIKNRIQPKQEWSEEDEKMLNGIVDTVKDARCQSLLSEIEIYDDYIDWLKSLKDRYTWKPSKEQLECLDVAIDKVDKDHSPFFTNRAYLTLKALKKQLKKLTE